MAEVKKIATRDSYGNTLKELAAEGHDDLVVLDADLAAATKTGMFRKAYPDRHFDCGIAEGNMMGVAAGLATMGYIFLYFSLPCLPPEAVPLTDPQIDRLPSPERQDRCHPRRHLCGRGRCFPPVLRGLCPDAQPARHDRDLPRRRCGSPRRCACRLRHAGPCLPALWPSGCACVPG